MYIHVCNNFLVAMLGVYVFMLCVFMSAKMLCACLRAIILYVYVVCVCVNDLCV